MLLLSMDYTKKEHITFGTNDKAIKEQAEEIVVVESKQTLDLSSQGLLQVPESVFRSTNTKILNLLKF